MPKNTFFGLFLIFCLRRTKICQNSVFLVLWESSEISEISEILDWPLFRTTLCRQKNLNLHAKKIFLENVCLRTKFDLRLKKKIGEFSVVLGKIVVAIKKMLVIQFSYMKIVFKPFVSKKKVFFLITRLFYLVQIAAETSSNLFLMIF